MRVNPAGPSPEPDYPDLTAFAAERRAFLRKLGAVAGAVLAGGALAGCDARAPVAADPPVPPPVDPPVDPPRRTAGEAQAPEPPQKTAGEPLAPAKEPEQAIQVAPDQSVEVIRGRISAPAHPREDLPPGK